MAASETIYGVHENQSVKRSGQAGGAVRASKLNVQINLKKSKFSFVGNVNVRYLAAPTSSKLAIVLFNLHNQYIPISSIASTSFWAHSSELICRRFLIKNYI
ncbi:hypothetical protein FPI19_08700 [Salmonella enterica]|nr:hypothetical protein [Salmonella enterica]EBG2841651.1 hypothetical protein [Salmonella enterica subsp. enterica serovar Javiana]ECD3657403.1 hypothetical protein [Salmonella enterica subsp. enterica]KAA5864255.1 hypothetical protein FS846_27595 [Klebsiella pneumoniae]ROG15931.1 hypothetical protein C4Y62_022360 [Klebsiella pneumoniae subsp. pneumoniae]